MTSSTQAHGPEELQFPQPEESAGACCWSDTEELEVSGGDMICDMEKAFEFRCSDGVLAILFRCV